VHGYTQCNSFATGRTYTGSKSTVGTEIVWSLLYVSGVRLHSSELYGVFCMSYLCLFISVVSVESIMVFLFISSVIRVQRYIRRTKRIANGRENTRGLLNRVWYNINWLRLSSLVLCELYLRANIIHCLFSPLNKNVGFRHEETHLQVGKCCGSYKATWAILWRRIIGSKVTLKCLQDPRQINRYNLKNVRHEISKYPTHRTRISNRQN
jgi:hypothetical protein